MKKYIKNILTDNVWWIFTAITLIFFGTLYKMEFAVDTYATLSFTMKEFINQFASSGRFLLIFVGIIFKILNFNNNNCNLENFISRIFYDKDIDLKRDKEFLIEITKSNSGRKSIHALINYIEENALSIIDFSQIILGVLKSFVDEEYNQENIYFYGDELSKLVVALYDETEGKNELEMKKLASECLDIWDKMFERQIGTIKLLSKEILDR